MAKRTDEMKSYEDTKGDLEEQLRQEIADRKIQSRMPFGGRTNVEAYEGYGLGEPRLTQEMIDLQVSGVDVAPFGPYRQPDQAQIIDPSHRSISPSTVGRTGREYRFPSKGRMPAATVTTPNLGEVRTEVRDEFGREIPTRDRMDSLGEFRAALKKAKAELGPMQSYAPEFEDALFRVMREQALRLQIPDAELARSVEDLEQISEAASLGQEGAGEGLPVSRLKGTAADYRRNRN